MENDYDWSLHEQLHGNYLISIKLEISMSLFFFNLKSRDNNNLQEIK